MPVPDKESDLLYFHRGTDQQIGRCFQPSRTHNVTEMHSGFLFEQALKMSGTEIDLLREFPHRMRQLRLQAVQNFSQTLLLNHGNQCAWYPVRCLAISVTAVTAVAAFDLSRGKARYSWTRSAGPDSVAHRVAPCAFSQDPGKEQITVCASSDLRNTAGVVPGFCSGKRDLWAAGLIDQIGGYFYYTTETRVKT
jgi:hypothetical protein